MDKKIKDVIVNKILIKMDKTSHNAKFIKNTISGSIIQIPEHTFRPEQCLLR
jgi:hypothetical protein